MGLRWTGNELFSVCWEEAFHAFVDIYFHHSVLAALVGSSLHFSSRLFVQIFLKFPFHTILPVYILLVLY